MNVATGQRGIPQTPVQESEMQSRARPYKHSKIAAPFASIPHR